MSKTSFINEDSLKWVLSTPHGRKVLWDILAYGGLYHQPFSADSRRVTDFNCGRKDTALVLMSECLTASAEHVALMMKEQENVADDTADTSAGNSTDTRSSTARYLNLGDGDQRVPDEGFDA